MIKIKYVAVLNLSFDTILAITWVINILTLADHT